MPSLEHPRGHHSKEKEPLPYYQAARFVSEETAGRAYFEAQRTIFKNPDCDLSVFRLQLERVWHVAVLGDPPPPDLEQKLLTILSAGDPVSLPANILQILQERRAQAIKRGPWLEGHYRPGKRV